MGDLNPTQSKEQYLFTPSGLATGDQGLEVYGTGVLWVDCQLPPPLLLPACGVLQHICTYLFSVYSIPLVPIAI